MSEFTPIPVAIADDHAMFRQSISRSISAFSGFRVIIEASNGKQLIELLSAAKELPQICILDIQMPEMDGYETLLEIRRRWPDIRVLVLSMFNNEFAIIKMLRNGAKGYLLKDSDLEELERALTHIHNNGYYSSEFLSSRFFQSFETVSDKSLQKLNERDMEILKLCCTDLTMKEIGERMGINTRTAEFHRNSLFDRFDVHTRQGLTVFALGTGLVSLKEITELNKSLKA